VLLYHISGCLMCHDCREGYMISCTAASRAAYGWQRDGGHAEYILAEESTCILLPEELSYTDGALVSCGFGTVYEAILRVKVCGKDAVFVSGLGPIGLAAALVSKKMGAYKVIGSDINENRMKLAESLGCVDMVVNAADKQALQKVKAATNEHGCEISFDCSGSPQGRLLALQCTRRWGRCAMIGEGNKIEFDVSQTIIHNQITIFGSWVTNMGHMEELVERLVHWKLNPEIIVTHVFSLTQADKAYQLMDQGDCGKVVVAMDEELKRLQNKQQQHKNTQYKSRL